MKQSISLIAVVVPDYDEAIGFYVGTLGFSLVEDTYIPDQDKRWVVVAPQGKGTTQILLARAVNDDQNSRIGNQAGGRVFLFLYTDDFWRDFNAYKEKGGSLCSRSEERALWHRRGFQRHLWKSLGFARAQCQVGLFLGKSRSLLS